MRSDAAKIRHFERSAPRQFTLDTERPLADVGRRLTKLIGENECRRSGLGEGLRPGQVRRQGVGYFILPDGKGYVPHDVEHGVADITHIVQACSGADHGLLIELPGEAHTRREIVPVTLECAASEAPVTNELERRSYRKLRITLEQVARSGADEYGVVAVVPDIIDVDDRIMLVEEWWFRFPAQSEIHC